MASPIEVYTAHPLLLSPTTKAVSSDDAHLADALDDLNRLHRQLLTLETPQQTPPPPAPVNPKRSVQIAKLKDSGNAAYKKGAPADAVKMYDLALRMAIDRPAWEPAGLVRDELSMLYGNRAQALMALQAWPEAALNAEIAVELKRVGNVKAWWRRGQALREMGRLREALEWVASGLDLERLGPEKANVGELESLKRELEKALEAKKLA